MVQPPVLCKCTFLRFGQVKVSLIAISVKTVSWYAGTLSKSVGLNLRKKISNIFFLQKNLPLKQFKIDSEGQ